MQKIKRALLKISGEFFGEESRGGTGISQSQLAEVASQIKTVHERGVQLACVVGGGNIFRGKDANTNTLEDTTAHQMGMLATAINAMALRDILRSMSVAAEVLTSVPLGNIAKPYSADLARQLLDLGTIVICAGGTGNPFFTTDTAAVLRALETHCDVVLKGTQVDGVYDRDPRKFPDARKYDTLTMDEALDQKLAVMDATAFTLCRENKLPMIVFNIHVAGNLLRVVTGEACGTRVGVE